jgi:subtilisin family serine protease
MTKSSLWPLLTLAVLLLVAQLVPAADLLRDVLPGDEVEDTLEPGDDHGYRLSLVTGTEIRLRLDAEPDDEDADAEPLLVLLDPTGGEVGRSEGQSAEIRRTVGASGTYVAEVRAGSFEGDYTLDIDAELPESVEGEVEVTDGPSAFRIDVPVGSSVSIEVIRVSGSPPLVTAVRDGTGRELGFLVRSASRRRVRLHPVPVSSPGGLFVDVAARDGGTGTYEVRGRPTDDDDEIPDDEEEEVEPRRIVLFLEPGTDPAAVAAALGYELKDVRDGFIVLETPEGREGFEREDARAAAELLSEVIAGEPDVTAQTPEGSQSNGIALGSSFGRADFDSQTAFSIVQAPLAHRRATGQGVTVAVLDTGIDPTHPLLEEHTLPGFDFVDGDADPTEVSNAIDDDGDGAVDEGFGHGTFVAGLVLGAAPDAQILPVRVLDSDARGSASAVAAGIEFAVDQGADVINLSLGMRGRSEVLRGAVRFAISRGVTVVASTGNGADTRAVDFPGGVASVVAVSALSESGGRASFANASSRTAVAAPGVDLVGPYPDGRWGTWSGTSFSAALVSGGAALVKERRPGLSPKRVRRLIQRRARGIRRIPRSERRLLGGGRLNLRRLAR